MTNSSPTSWASPPLEPSFPIGECEICKELLLDLKFSTLVVMWCKGATTNGGLGKTFDEILGNPIPRASNEFFLIVDDVPLSTIVDLVGEASKLPDE